MCLLTAEKKTAGRSNQSGPVGMAIVTRKFVFLASCFPMQMSRQTLKYLLVLGAQEKRNGTVKWLFLIKITFPGASMANEGSYDWCVNSQPAQVLASACLFWAVISLACILNSLDIEIVLAKLTLVSKLKKHSYRSRIRQVKTGRTCQANNFGCCAVLLRAVGIIQKGFQRDDSVLWDRINRPRPFRIMSGEMCNPNEATSAELTEQARKSFRGTAQVVI